MAKKVKKQLKASQKQKKFRAIQHVTYGSEFVSLATPFVIMGAINFDEWFKTTEGWKVGLGGALAMALLVIAALAITKKKEDKKSKTSGYVGFLLAWLAAAFVFLLLANIMHEIATIMFFGAIGIAGALGLEIVSKTYKEKSDLYAEAIREVKKDSAKEEAKREIMKEVEEEVKNETEHEAVE